MNKVKVIKKNSYFTLVATERISKGEVILKLTGTLSGQPNKYSVQADETKHIFSFSDDPNDPASSFRFINHSCSPNSYFDIPNLTLLALKDIPKNEEVVYHYCTTEYDIAFPFTCFCRSENCLKEIKGFRYLQEKIKNELLPYLAPHLKKHLKESSL